MQTDKPRPSRVYVTARDPDGTSRSESITVYDSTPKQVIKLIEGAVAANAEHRQTKPPRRRRDPAAA
jgi:hypothetical protein